MLQDSQQDDIIHDLIEHGYSVVSNFVAADAVQALRADVNRLWSEGDFKAAAIGRGAGEQRQTEIRGDFIHWLSPTELTLAQAPYWDRIDQLRQRINRELFLNVQEFEAHLALYLAGAFYKRHLDQHQNTQRRQIACILYLNDGWKPADGGYLRIYPKMGNWEQTVDVLPQGGTFVCFRCDTIVHEVLPATRQRMSLTGWLCRRE